MESLRAGLRTSIVECRDALDEARRTINRWRNDPEASVVDDHEARFVLEKMDDASFRKWTRWTVMAIGVVYLFSGTLMLLA